MSKLYQRVNVVAKMNGAYPQCVVDLANELVPLFEKRRNGVSVLHSELKEVRKFRLKVLADNKKLGLSYRHRHMAVVSDVRRMYGKEKYEDYCTAVHARNQGKLIINSLREEFDSCIRLIHEENLDRVYEWCRCVNATEVNKSLTDVAYVRNIRPMYLAEILAFKHMALNAKQKILVKLSRDIWDSSFEVLV